MPKWFVLQTLTHPEPTASAFSIAIALALGPTTRPSPLSPSTVAVPGNSRTIADLRPGVDPAEGQHVEVGVQPRHAVRVDAPQVARRQHVGGLPGVGLGDAEVPEDPRGELARAARWGRSAVSSGDGHRCLRPGRVRRAWEPAARRSSCRC